MKASQTAHHRRSRSVARTFAPVSGMSVPALKSDLSTSDKVQILMQKSSRFLIFPKDESAYSLEMDTTKERLYSPWLHTIKKLAFLNIPFYQPLTVKLIPNTHFFPLKLRCKTFHTRIGRINDATHFYLIRARNDKTACSSFLQCL